MENVENNGTEKIGLITPTPGPVAAGLALAVCETSENYWSPSGPPVEEGWVAQSILSGLLR